MLALLLLLAGCNPDCDDPARLNGSWQVETHVAVEEDALEGDNLEAYPYEDALFNGTRDWNLQYVPAEGAFRLRLDGQTFTATYAEAETNCNAFQLKFSGLYTAEVGTTHQLAMLTDLVYQGDVINGTFRYEDTWQGADAVGSIVVPAGELTAR